MGKRVVFAGGVQAKALAKAYRLDVAAERDEDVFFIPGEAMAREAAHRVVAAADVLVTDITEAGPTVPDSMVPASAERLSVPVILGDFLWPFAGRPHPRNAGVPALKDGPYPASFGDSYLDSLMQEAVPEDEAVSRYLALDIASVADLDGLLTRRLETLVVLDRRTGFDLAYFVDQEFRSLNLFATFDRLRLPLFRHLAAAVFSRMGYSASVGEALLEAPFQVGAMPIHPGVLQHFAMQAPRPDHRYPVLDEGLFTFAQYCRRYLRYEWNENLHAGIALAEANPAEAIPLLRQALEISPGSRAGQRALEDAERALAESAKAAPLVLAAPDPPPRYVPPPPPPLPPPPVQQPGQPLPEARFAPDGLGLRFPTSRSDTSLISAFNPAQPAATTSTALSRYSPPARPASSGQEPPPPELEAAAPEAALVPEPQSYVELPYDLRGLEAEAAPPPIAPPANRYTPLPPAQDLIEVLPRMLPTTRGLAGIEESPFASMPETMPPPPLRPVLPPELHPEPMKRSFVAKLFGGGH
jgi:hypothetical protein